MRRILGIALAVLLIGGVIAVMVTDRGTATKTVRGVIGSEKSEYFRDPDVVKALADKGYTVKTETSGSWAMDQLAVLATEPKAVHALSRAIRLDVPECVDTYSRTRWWNRLTPGGESPERHLERQLDLLYEEAERLTADLREAEARRQLTHTTYLEERGRS